MNRWHEACSPVGMILLTSTGSALRQVIREGLVVQGEDVWPVISGSSIELMLAACGCDTLLYVAGASLLEAQLSPQPSESRARQVLHAAAMPGVKLVVGVVPSGEDYADEEQLLLGGGVPAVILRCAPLVEEVEASPDVRAQLRGWSRFTTGAMLSSTIARALRDASWQGQVIEVPTLRVDPARRARVTTRVSLPKLEGVPAFACVA